MSREPTETSESLSKSIGDAIGRLESAGARKELVERHQAAQAKLDATALQIKQEKEAAEKKAFEAKKKLQSAQWTVDHLTSDSDLQEKIRVCAATRDALIEKHKSKGLTDSMLFNLVYANPLFPKNETLFLSHREFGEKFTPNELKELFAAQRDFESANSHLAWERGDKQLLKKAEAASKETDKEVEKLHEKEVSCLQQQKALLSAVEIGIKREEDKAAHRLEHEKKMALLAERRAVGERQKAEALDKKNAVAIGEAELAYNHIERRLSDVKEEIAFLLEKIPAFKKENSELQKLFDALTEKFRLLTEALEAQKSSPSSSEKHEALVKITADLRNIYLEITKLEERTAVVSSEHHRLFALGDAVSSLQDDTRVLFEKTVSLLSVDVDATLFLGKVPILPLEDLRGVSETDILSEITARFETHLQDLKRYREATELLYYKLLLASKLEEATHSVLSLLNTTGPLLPKMPDAKDRPRFQKKIADLTAQLDQFDHHEGDLIVRLETIARDAKSLEREIGKAAHKKLPKRKMPSENQATTIAETTRRELEAAEAKTRKELEAAQKHEAEKFLLSAAYDIAHAAVTALRTTHLPDNATKTNVERQINALIDRLNAQRFHPSVQTLTKISDDASAVASTILALEQRAARAEELAQLREREAEAATAAAFFMVQMAALETQQIAARGELVASVGAAYTGVLVGARTRLVDVEEAERQRLSDTALQKMAADAARERDAIHRAAEAEREAREAREATFRTKRAAIEAGEGHARSHLAGTGDLEQMGIKAEIELAEIAAAAAAPHTTATSAPQLARAAVTAHGETYYDDHATLEQQDEIAKAAAQLFEYRLAERKKETDVTTFEFDTTAPVATGKSSPTTQTCTRSAKKDDKGTAVTWSAPNHKTAAEVSLAFRIEEQKALWAEIAKLQNEISSVPTSPVTASADAAPSTEEVKLAALNALNKAFDPRTVEVELASRGKSQKYTCGDKPFEASEEEILMVQAHLKAGYTTVVLATGKGDPIVFTAGDEKKILPPTSFAGKPGTLFADTGDTRTRPPSSHPGISHT